MRGFCRLIKFKERDREKRSVKVEMMIGGNPTVQIPCWDPYDDPAAGVHSPYSVPSPTATGDYLASLHRYLPSNEPDAVEAQHGGDAELMDDFLCDHFRMYVFKVRRCSRSRSHDWTDCPYAHPGEKARRRDPRRFHYSGTSCPDFRKGVCKKGDSCEFAHGVFECWLHPDRYRTQPCKDGLNCRRRVCFFAHSPDQLRILPQQSSPCSVESDYGTPVNLSKPGSFLSSPTSILSSPPISPPSDSPPMSPSGHNSVNELVASMRGLSFGKPKLSPRSQFASGFGKSRCSTLCPGAYVTNLMPSTPTRAGLGGGFDLWESPFEEEPAMERVESGRNIRAGMYAKLSKENSLDLVVEPACSGPDLGWVSELVK